MIRWGSILYIVTALLHVFIVVWIGNGNNTNGSDENYNNSSDTAYMDSAAMLQFLALTIVMVLWGIGNGIVEGPYEALFADSTPQGQRTYYYHVKYVVYLFSGIFGPLVTIILFQRLGNMWTMQPLRIIIFVGLVVEIISAILMLFLDDKKALKEQDEEESDSESESSSSYDDELQTGDDNYENGEETMLLNHHYNAQPYNSTIKPISTIANKRTRDKSQPTSSSFFGSWIPYVIFSADLLSEFGSGMTSAFFPLYFKNFCGMDPLQVQIIYVVKPICSAVFSSLATHSAKHFGRVGTILLFWGVCILLFYSIAWFELYFREHHTALVIIYLLEATLGNGLTPIEESLLSDLVPKSQRATWLSLGSVVEFGGSGSAILGGYICDKWGYRQAFFLSCYLDMASWILYAFLLRLLPPNKQ